MTEKGADGSHKLNKYTVKVARFSGVRKMN